MTENAVWNKEKGRMIILGHRHVAVDMEGMCEHMDSLLGSQVAEVVMNNHEIRLGKEDAERIRREKPNATLEEIIRHITEADRLSGMGIANVQLLPNATNPKTVLVEVTDPPVKKTAGASKAFICSYWSGVAGVLLGGEFEAKNVAYHDNRNMFTYELVRRRPTNQMKA